MMKSRAFKKTLILRMTMPFEWLHELGAKVLNEDVGRRASRNARRPPAAECAPQPHTSPHLPHPTHQENSKVSKRRHASVVNCNACEHFTASESSAAGIGTCILNVWQKSRSAPRYQRMPPFAFAPRYCNGFRRRIVERH